MRSYGFWLAILLASTLVSLALADGELDSMLTQGDKDRLAKYESIRDEAIADARAGGDAADIEELDRVLASGALPFDESFDFIGDWRCRTIKLGGSPALTVYGWFRCRVSDDGAGWRIEKLTGSQRLSGRFYTDSDTRLVFVGAGHYGDEKPRSYGADPERDAVAYVTRAESGRVRLEFPLPKFESKLDILELVK